MRKPVVQTKPVLRLLGLLTVFVATGLLLAQIPPDRCLVPASVRGTAAGWLALVDPQRRLLGWFTPHTPPATIAGDIKALARAPRAD